MGGPGSGGHNRKPVSAHVLEGTYRPDRHGNGGKGLPLGAFGPAECPEFLEGEAREFWDREAPRAERLGTLDAALQPLFAGLAQQWAIYVEATDYLALNGPIAEGPRGPRVHPYVRIEETSARRVLSGLKTFGLTPASRARLGLPASAKPEAANPWKAIKGGITPFKRADGAGKDQSDDDQ